MWLQPANEKQANTGLQPVGEGVVVGSWGWMRGLLLSTSDNNNLPAGDTHGAAAPRSDTSDRTEAEELSPARRPLH